MQCSHVHGQNKNASCNDHAPMTSMPGIRNLQLPSQPSTHLQTQHKKVQICCQNGRQLCGLASLCILRQEAHSRGDAPVTALATLAVSALLFGCHKLETFSTCVPTQLSPGASSTGPLVASAASTHIISCTSGTLCYMKRPKYWWCIDKVQHACGYQAALLALIQLCTCK